LIKWWRYYPTFTGRYANETDMGILVLVAEGRVVVDGGVSRGAHEPFSEFRKAREACGYTFEEAEPVE
jgi:hypothetical protein